MKRLPLALLVLATCAPTAAAAPLPASGTLDLAAAPGGTSARWTATEKGGLAGGAVAGLTDFDGDGKRDVAVGEPKADTAAGKDAGVVRVLTRPGTGGKLGDALAITGAAAGDNLGFDVAAAGDVNGDGLTDVLIGAPLAGAVPTATGTTGAAGTAGPAAVPPTGAAYLVYGRKGTAAIDLAAPDFGGVRLTGAEAGSFLGRSVASLPDVNGDGRPELLIGAPARDAGGRKDAGSAYVVFGTTAPTVDVSKLAEEGTGYRVDGPAAGALAGRALGAIGDLNGDGRPELLLTAPRAGDSGRAYVLFGRATPGVIDLAQLGSQGYAIDGPPSGVPGSWLGESIAAAGDANGDGTPDLVVGAHLGDGPDRVRGGLAFVLFGKDDATTVDLAKLGDGGFRITGVSAQDQTGFAVAPAGDFNADGLDDVAVSAPLADPLSRETAGAVYVVYGRKGEAKDVDLAEIGDRGIRIAGVAGDTLGFALDAAGDLDGDGGDDLAIGAVAIDTDYLLNVQSPGPGSLAIVFGAAGKPGEVPGAEIKADPGYVEALKAGCLTALNVQAVLDDDFYNDKRADPGRIRLAGMQSYVDTPANLGTVLGVSAFEADEESASPPIFTPTEIRPGNADLLKGKLFRGITGEDEFPGYGRMFQTLADDNPSAGARIMVIDGYTFEGVSELEGLTDGSAPTYIVAIGAPPDRSRDDIRQMQRVTRETKGRFFLARSPRQLERALQAIQSRIRCDEEADDFRANLDREAEQAIAETDIESGVHTADVNVSWRDDDEDYEIERVDVIDDDGDLVRQIDDEEVRDAYAATSRSAPAVGGRGRTFRALHIRSVREGTRLRVVVRAEGRSSGRVYARITQSRRRR